MRTLRYDNVLSFMCSARGGHVATHHLVLDLQKLLLMDHWDRLCLVRNVLVDHHGGISGLILWTEVMVTMRFRRSVLDRDLTIQRSIMLLSYRTSLALVRWPSAIIVRRIATSTEYDIKAAIFPIFQGPLNVCPVLIELCYWLITAPIWCFILHLHLWEDWRGIWFLDEILVLIHLGNILALVMVLSVIFRGKIDLFLSLDSISVFHSLREEIEVLPQSSSLLRWIVIIVIIVNVTVFVKIW